jgi:Leucine-rich repeat (LRR) protein
LGENVNLINFAEKLSEQIPALQIIVNNPALNITLKAEAIKQFFDDPQNNPTLQNITHLDLSNKNLSDLPPEIGKLVNLRELVIFKNQITHLPPQIGNLVNLQKLDLSHNQITHFPPEIGNLVNLQRLYLSHNQITHFPPEIGDLVNLRRLDLLRNPLNYQKEFYFHPDPLIRSEYRIGYHRSYDNILLIATILLITGVSMMSMFYFNRIRGTQQT